MSENKKKFSRYGVFFFAGILLPALNMLLASNAHDFLGWLAATWYASAYAYETWRRI